MSPSRLVTPFRRDIVLALVALGLVVAPLWIPALGLAEPTYRYERTEVTANGTTIEYANDDDGELAFRTPISDEIACTGRFDPRPCALERQVLENRTVPSGLYSSTPNRTTVPFDDPYAYVHIDDAVYRPTYVTNESNQGTNGMYRVELDLERVDPERALRRVSIDVTRDDLSLTVVETARDGTGRSAHEVDVPETPIRLEDGTYYRVYETSHSDPSLIGRGGEFLLTVLAPLFGLGLIGRLSRRFDVTHVG